jgi:predicted metal-binding membrane protein
MRPIEANALARIGEALRRAAWERPEWWALATAAGAWAFMLPHAIQHGAHARHHVMTPLAELVHWLLMIIAMMVPLMTDAVRFVAFRSLALRRHRAIATFLLGYLGVWLACGLPVVALRRAAFTHNHLAAAIAFLAAAGWTLSNCHQRAVKACHYQGPLAPYGWPATRDGVRYGARLGVACVVSCWPLMLACTLTGHSVIAMLATGAIGAWERLSFRPPYRLVALGIGVLAAWHLGLALVQG